MATGKSENRELRRRWKHSRRKAISHGDAQRLERNAFSPKQRKYSPRVSRHFRVERIPALQRGLSRDSAGSFSHPTTISLGLALDLLRGYDHGHATWNWIFPARDSRQRSRSGRAGLCDEFSNSSFSRARRRGSRFPDRRRLDAKRDLFHRRPLSSPSAGNKSRGPQL